MAKVPACLAKLFFVAFVNDEGKALVCFSLASIFTSLAVWSHPSLRGLTFYEKYLLPAGWQCLRT